ncbi:MAG: DNA repair protein RadC [SAR324 cluster bacterium]|nr:DNA repair protein RadC [SAR324 cluster bacterium]
MVLSHHREIPDKDLLHRLLRIPQKDMQGEDIRGILENLLNRSIKTEKVQLISEVAQRYGEKRLWKGDAISTSSQVFDHFHLRLAELKQEMFISVLLDNKHRIINEHLITVGTLNQSLVHPREVFSKAIELSAAAIILIHNHPSGNPEPSRQDKDISKRLVDAGNIVGIKVLDHIIIGNTNYYSFIDEDVMPE